MIGKKWWSQTAEAPSSSPYKEPVFTYFKLQDRIKFNYFSLKEFRLPRSQTQ